MSATTSGALKAHIEGLGLHLSVFRDAAPPDQPLPFAVVQESISNVPERDGDYGDHEVSHGTAEEAQVSLFQQWRTTDGRAAENYRLADTLVAMLHGAQLRDAPTRVYGVRVNGRVRVPPRPTSAAEGPNGANVVQDTIMLTIRRNL